MKITTYLVLLMSFSAYSVSAADTTASSKGMSLSDATNIAELILKEDNYSGQAIVANSIQDDNNFYAFKFLQISPNAGNFDFTIINVNRFTGAVWFSVGDDCSKHTSKLLKDRETAIVRNNGWSSSVHAKLNKPLPQFCES